MRHHIIARMQAELARRSVTRVMVAEHRIPVCLHADAAGAIHKHNGSHLLAFFLSVRPTQHCLAGESLS